MAVDKVKSTKASDVAPATSSVKEKGSRYRQTQLKMLLRRYRLKLRGVYCSYTVA